MFEEAGLVLKIKHWVSSLKHFFKILQNLGFIYMQNSYCDHRNFDG
jgi:hypothetical protein